jgi:hypothetical protein
MTRIQGDLLAFAKANNLKLIKKETLHMPGATRPF